MYYRRGYHERAKLLLQLAQSGHSIVDPKAARLKLQFAIVLRIKWPIVKTIAG